MQTQSKILVVDDDLYSIAIVEELFGEDYDLKTAATGEEALEIAPNFLPDLVLLDIMMPGMDGYEVCRRLREHSTLKYTKIIMVSAKAIVSDRLDGYEAGADDYLTKPFEEDELMAKVHVYLRLKYAEEMDQMRREFTMTVTHEMRTPMTVVKGILSNAMANIFWESSAKLRQQLETADRYMDRLARIISNFFDISRIDAGKIELQLTRFCVQSMVLDVVELLKPKAALRKIELNTNMPVEELFVSADRDKVIKILTHLINNAVIFIHEGDSINVRVGDLGEKIRIDVEDSGPGIESNKIDQIFNRFVQVEKIVGPGEHGTGLGLAIAKELVELHGGRIWAQNIPESGAMFSFEIPISVQSKTVTEAVSVSSVKGLEDGRRARI